MPDLPPRLRDVLSDLDAPWTSQLTPEEAAAAGTVLAQLPEQVVLAVLSALSDPERALWGAGVIRACHLVREAGGEIGGLLAEDVIECIDEAGGRVGLAVVPVPSVGPRWGSVEALRLLCDRLDRTFAHRRYVLFVRRALPDVIDVDGIARAVSLWLSAVERGERHEKHAVYEDGDIAFELTLVEGGGAGAPRVLTVGPVDALERLAAVDSEVVELAVQLEESLGDLPVVVSLASDASWRLPRGYVEQLLYGTADAIVASQGSYEATFRPNGRSLFSDPVCRYLVGLWWTSPTDDGGTAAIAHDNPWSRGVAQLSPPCRRFAPAPSSDDGARGAGEVTLRWWGGRLPTGVEEP
jgi:hypothetical protein